MGKSVYIAEKPSVAQEFAKALKLNTKRRDGYLESDEAIVTWCVGHLVTMSYPEEYDPALKRWNLQTLPFIPEEFKYEVIPSVAKQFQIVSSFGTSIPTLNVVEAGQEESTASSSGSGPKLDVNVLIPNRFFVRGKGLESEWKGNLQVSGPATNPVVTGSINSIRGQFSLLGKQFTLSRGDVEFSGATPPDPLLNVLVTYAAANITAEATVSGPASSPTLTLSSQPPLPQDEVVAQVLFGQSASSLGRMEAIQLAAELASLSGFGSGGMGVLGEVRDTLGFDVLRFGSMQNGPKQQTSRNVGLLQPPGQSSGSSAQEDSIPSLEVGKYVMDNVYVGLEQGMNGDASGVRVEIELAPNLNLEGVSTPQGSEVGLNWKKDY